jgi:hypothetical protein
MINEKTDTKEGYTVVKEESSVGRFDISRIILEEETDFINSENELDESERDEMRKLIILENDLEDELEECEIDEIHRILMIENNLENGLEESECTVMQAILMSEMDAIFSSDDEDNTPSISTSIAKRDACGLCCRFHYSQYKCVRVRYALLSTDKTPGQIIDCDDYDDNDIYTLPLQDCCIQYYSKWVQTI